MKRCAVIMAGGSGERFWPLSRAKRPKQLLRLASAEKMMIEESIDRISPLIKPEDIFIITSEVLQQPMREALTMLPAENIIAEPLKRNTAPCLALSASVIAARYPELKANEISIAVLTADQSISPKEGFVSTVDKAMNYVEEKPVLCTIGIQPSRPETGYGYVEVKEPFIDGGDAIQNVLKFHEKPDVDRAQKYLEAGNYLWNSGMFFWRLDTFIGSMEKCLPEVGTKINTMADEYKPEARNPIEGAHKPIYNYFEAFPNTSIDYGLMEKADNVVVARAEFDWDDVGSWDSLERIRPMDEAGNIISGANAVFDTKDSIIINESTNQKTVISTFGMENIVVVVTDDAVLVCPKDRVQEVKKSVEIIRENDGNKWL